MNVIRLLGVALILASCEGCGKDAQPPAAAPPPFVPAADRLPVERATDEAKPAAPAADTENAVADDAGSAETPSDDEMVDEDGTPRTPPVATDADDSTAPAKVAADETEPSAAAEAPSADPQPEPAATNPAKAKSGKWVRGLTNALSRAVGKSLKEASKSKDSAVKPPAPEDDPFPNGEPDDEKPEE